MMYLLCSYICCVCLSRHRSRDIYAAETGCVNAVMQFIKRMNRVQIIRGVVLSNTLCSTLYYMISVARVVFSYLYDSRLPVGLDTSRLCIVTTTVATV
jgi:hypothetical protein